MEDQKNGDRHTSNAAACFRLHRPGDDRRGDPLFKYHQWIGQVRFIGLLIIGVAIITAATLSTAQNIISLLVLDLIMIWTLLIPIIAFLVMGERRDTAMKSMREWLNRNQRIINVVVFAFFGIALLIKGLSVIFG